jgi:hypothetical protein
MAQDGQFDVIGPAAPAGGQEPEEPAEALVQRRGQHAPMVHLRLAQHQVRARDRVLAPFGVDTGTWSATCAPGGRHEVDFIAEDAFQQE